MAYKTDRRRLIAYMIKGGSIRSVPPSRAVERHWTHANLNGRRYDWVAGNRLISRGRFILKGIEYKIYRSPYSKSVFSAKEIV